MPGKATVGSVFGAIAFIVSGYNKAVTLDEAVNSQWAQIDTQLQRRCDFLPAVKILEGWLEQYRRDVGVPEQSADSDSLQAS